MYPKDVNTLPVSIRERARIERRIVRKLVNELLTYADVALSVFDGEDEHPVTTDKDKLFAALIETDEDVLHVYVKGEHEGAIVLIYGNDGYDVMSDWSTCLDVLMPQTLALVERLSA